MLQHVIFVNTGGWLLLDHTKYVCKAPVTIPWLYTMGNIEFANVMVDYFLISCFFGRTLGWGLGPPLLEPWGGGWSLHYWRPVGQMTAPPWLLLRVI